MLPHSRGEAESIANVFHECTLGMHNLDVDSMDETAGSWILKLQNFMNTDGIDDPNEQGTHAVKAKQFTQDQMLELSIIVDDLADWFDRQDS